MIYKSSAFSDLSCMFCMSLSLSCSCRDSISLSLVESKDSRKIRSASAKESLRESLGAGLAIFERRDLLDGYFY